MRPRPSPTSLDDPKRANSGGGIVARFAVTSIIVFLMIGGSLHVLISGQLRRQAEASAGAHAVVLTRAVLEDVLTPEDIRAPVTGDRYQELLRVALTRILIGDAVRVKVWRPDGTVVFSDERRLVGVRFEEEAAEMQEVIEEGPISELSDLTAGENLYEVDLADELFATYVPLRVGPVGEPNAVAELYQDYAPTAAATSSSLAQMDVIVGGGFLLLYLLLLPVARNAGTTLKRQTLDLQRQRDDLESLVQERGALLRNVVRAQEDERTRIAGDIHDDSIQAVTEVAWRLEGVRRRMHDPEGLVRLQGVDDAIRGTLERMRNLLFDLRPPSLEESGLGAAFTTYLSRASRKGFEFSVDNRLTTEPPQETRTIAYRIGQEALANVRKHSKATRVEILLEEVDGGLHMVITDDGVGMPERVPYRLDHLGLMSMRERAAVASGWCHVQGVPGEGTTAEVWLPMAPGARHAPPESGTDTPRPASEA
jgi:signal transduction histidine kinase